MFTSEFKLNQEFNYCYRIVLKNGKICLQPKKIVHMDPGCPLIYSKYIVP